MERWSLTVGTGSNWDDTLRKYALVCTSRQNNASLTDRAPAWPSSPWQNGWRRNRSRLYWARWQREKTCRPSPANPCWAPPRSGSPLPERSSGLPGFRGDPPAVVGSEGRTGWTERRAGRVGGGETKQPVNGYRTGEMRKSVNNFC